MKEIKIVNILNQHMILSVKWLLCLTMAIVCHNILVLHTKYNLQPLQLYLDRLYEKFGMIALNDDNDFQITPIWALFLYICNPNDIYIS